jgi:hypothetical protein
MLRSLLLTCVGAFALIAPPAHAAEIALERSAIDKLVAQALYHQQGRLYLVRGACSAWLEQPAVSLAQGRIRIRTRFNGRVGQPTAQGCSGQAFDTWVTMSAEPAAAGGIVRLQKLRIEKVDDPMLQLLLDAGLGATLPAAVELDVARAVQDMLSSAATDIRGTVERLDIESVAVAEDRLTVRFDFRLVGR